jgi:hypothetical protein
MENTIDQQAHKASRTLLRNQKIILPGNRNESAHRDGVVYIRSRVLSDLSISCTVQRRFAVRGYNQRLPTTQHQRQSEVRYFIHRGQASLAVVTSGGFIEDAFTQHAFLPKVRY